MADEDKTVNVVIKYSQDGAQDVANTTQQINSSQQSYNKQLSQTESSFRSLRMAGRELSQISREALVAGAALTAGIVLDANNYVKTVGQTTALGASWINTTNQIKQANLQIGQTATSVMLPAYQQLGDVIEQIASIVQSNPWMISSALAVGGTLTAIGTIGTIVSSVIRVVADASLLIDKITNAGQLGATAAQTTATVANTAAVVANTAAQGGEAVIGGASGTGLLGMGAAGSVAGGAAAAGGLTVAGVAGVVLAGLGIGLAGYQAYASKTGAPGLNQFATVGAYEAGKLGGKIMGDSPQQTEMEAELMAAAVGKVTGALTDNSPLAEKAAATMAAAMKTIGDSSKTVIPQTAVDDFTSYQQQIANATTTYEAQRASIIENTESTITTDTENYEAQQAIDQRDYQQQLAKDQRNFQQQMAKDAATHQLDLQKMAQDHASKMQDLADSRDALGLVNEQNSYAQQVSQSDAQFALQEDQAKQSYANQLADEQQSFADKEADQKAAYDKQIAAAKAQEQKQLDAADTAYQKQIDDYQTAFVDKINAINSSILDDTAAYQTYLRNQSVQFQQWISNFERSGTASNNTPGSQYYIPPGANTVTQVGNYARQGGGWATIMGPGENGLPEYILSNPTALAAQQMLGGNLNQDNLLAALAGGGGTRGGSRIIQVQIVSNGLSVSDVKQIASDNLNITLGEVIKSFGPS